MHTVQLLKIGGALQIFVHLEKFFKLKIFISVLNIVKKKKFSSNRCIAKNLENILFFSKI